MAKETGKGRGRGEVKVWTIVSEMYEGIGLERKRRFGVREGFGKVGEEFLNYRWTPIKVDGVCNMEVGAVRAGGKRG